MNDSTRIDGRPRRATSPVARAVSAVVATAALALVAAACGGSAGRHVVRLGTTTTQGGTSSAGPSAASTAQAAAVAFARCMRSHRVPNWPDPNSSGAFDKSKLALQQLRVSSAQLQTAQMACRRLLPGGGNAPNLAQVQRMRAQGLRFSQCVRDHGVPGFPDPGSDGRIPDPASVGIDQGSPRFQAANQACRTSRPPYIPSNAGYNSYARTHGG